MIPYSTQKIDNKDIKAVVSVLKSPFLTQGPIVEKFENEISKKFQSKYSLATNSATSALHIACLALGVKEGDSVWTSPISFVASSNCVLMCGGKVDFIDINERTFNIDPELLEKKLEIAKIKKNLPKIIILVHFSGQPCNLEAIYKLKKKYDFKIIEDASHATGSKYKNNYIGNCKYSDIAIFSFHPVKIITTGEGGALLTNNKKIYSIAKLLRSHGITREKNALANKKMGSWFYEQKILGFNYRMSDINAALGLSQLEKIDVYINKRRKLASRYNEKINHENIVLPYQDKDCYSSFHLYVIKINLKGVKKTRQEIFDYFISHGIAFNLHYIPIYKQPFYIKINAGKKFKLKYSEEYYKTAFSIPLHPKLTINEQDFIINLLNSL